MTQKEEDLKLLDELILNYREFYEEKIHGLDVDSATTSLMKSMVDKHTVGKTIFSAKNRKRIKGKHSLKPYLDHNTYLFCLINGCDKTGVNYTMATVHFMNTDNGVMYFVFCPTLPEKMFVISRHLIDRISERRFKGEKDRYESLSLFLKTILSDDSSKYFYNEDQTSKFLLTEGMALGYYKEVDEGVYPKCATYSPKTLVTDPVTEVYFYKTYVTKDMYHDGQKSLMANLEKIQKDGVPDYIVPMIEDILGEFEEGDLDDCAKNLYSKVKQMKLCGYDHMTERERAGLILEEMRIAIESEKAS